MNSQLVRIEVVKTVMVQCPLWQGMQTTGMNDCRPRMGFSVTWRPPRSNAVDLEGLAAEIFPSTQH